MRREQAHELYELEKGWDSKLEEDAREEIVIDYPPKESCVRAERQAVYTCSNCRVRSVWTSSWSWYPEKRKNGSWHDPEPQYFACSDKCARELAQKHNLVLEIVG